MFVLPSLTRTRLHRAWISALLLSLGLQPVLAQSPAPGFTLMAPMASTDSHLLDSSGTVVHSWSSTHTPGLAAYLLDNGNLLRTIHTRGSIGGSGGGLQEIAWDGTIVWEYLYDGPGFLQHHDIEPLPNGNVLLIAWEDKTRAETIAAGRDPSTFNGSVFSPDHIIEVRKTGPTSGQIVWEWHVWDHLIQDFDPGQANFGVVADHPERVDINFPPRVVNNGDWIHANGIDYHAEFDQIVISARTFDEIWIIDHSTTTAEAAGHSGGRSGKGGDLLYRWGNPQSYRAGTATDKQLFGQHDPTWVAAGRPGEGNIMIFSNGVGRPAGNFSSVEEIVPPVDAQGRYTLVSGTAFGPAAPAWTYTAPNPTDFYSSTVSGAERLENGHTLICSGAQGRLFEVDAAKTLIWEHDNVLPNPRNNRIFKVRRYEHYLWPDAESLSAQIGGVIDFALEAGVAYANRNYLLLASFSGSSSGTPLPGGLATLPLNRDGLTDYVLANLQRPSLNGFTGTLDSLGAAQATLDTFGPLKPSLVGRTMTFAFAVYAPWDFASNPMTVEILP